MMRLLISLADFPDFVPFSVNVAAALVNPHIRDAQTFDVGPLLSAATWAALETALDAVMPEFKPDEFASAEFLTNATTAGWQDTALATLWYDAVRPLLVCESARNMLLWHGLHITPAGAQTVSDPNVGAQPISSTQRTELRANLASKCALYRAKLASAYRAYAPAATPTCSRPAGRVGRGGLHISHV